jgi:hypothetical protein
MDRLKRLTFRRNRVENGAAFFISTDELVFEENTILGHASHSALRLQHVSDALVSNNVITADVQEDIGVVQILNKDLSLSKDVVVRNNHISVAPGLTAIHVRDAAGGITLLENQIDGSGGGTGILFQSVVAANMTRTGFIVTDNVIQDFIYGVAFFDRGDNYSDVEVRLNTIDEQTTATGTIGLLFDGTGPYGAFSEVTSNTFGPGLTSAIVVR